MILAIFLDRITAALGTGHTPIGQLLARRKRRRQASAAAGSATSSADADLKTPELVGV